MKSTSFVAPEGAASILIIAKDTAGSWLVQEGLGRLKRTFASLEAALNFAGRAPYPFSGASIAISCGPTAPESIGAR